MYVHVHVYVKFVNAKEWLDHTYMYMGFNTFRLLASPILIDVLTINCIYSPSLYNEPFY